MDLDQKNRDELVEILNKANSRYDYEKIIREKEQQKNNYLANLVDNSPEAQEFKKKLKNNISEIIEKANIDINNKWAQINNIVAKQKGLESDILAGPGEVRLGKILTIIFTCIAIFFLSEYLGDSDMGSKISYTFSLVPFAIFLYWLIRKIKKSKAKKAAKDWLLLKKDMQGQIKELWQQITQLKTLINQAEILKRSQINERKKEFITQINELWIKYSNLINSEKTDEQYQAFNKVIEDCRAEIKKVEEFVEEHGIPKKYRMKGSLDALLVILNDGEASDWPHAVGIFKTDNHFEDLTRATTNVGQKVTEGSEIVRRSVEAFADKMDRDLNEIKDNTGEIKQSAKDIAQSSKENAEYNRQSAEYNRQTAESSERAARAAEASAMYNEQTAKSAKNMEDHFSR
ncbi:hypothetical protein FEZ51_06490 [Pediococcus stilesii]|uniref:Uncharacterized protein n=1 Tax=Pediococcus stilesii TaxID=331679 RepID=A0A5R9BVD9_9LACO|nr:hypothetical protein [Pediococcus stilesii]TLQ04070.1 hypothetical protein FEZ51_06490 [Pediococcus stilesii]